MPTKTTKRVILPIEGMTCAACVSHVEGALSHAQEISQVVVNLATEQATVVSNSLRLQRFKGSKA